MAFGDRAADLRLAVIADPHVHDPMGDFGLGQGFPALRPWEEIRTAARAVNESGPILDATLARIAARGIRLVAIAGDFSDDGQAENVSRLAGRLRLAEERLGLRIHVIPGNHDLYAVGGKHVAIRYATGRHENVLVTSDPTAGPARITPAMRCLGMPAALWPMAGFGLMRRADDLHWESPFGASDRFEDRTYVADAGDGVTRHILTDASYLVEPVAGLWLLMIDANVFVPRPGITDPRRKRAFSDPAGAGWQVLARQKPFLIRWIADVAARARRAGKVLVPISHYPVLAPLAGEDGEGAILFGKGAPQGRSPDPGAADTLAGAGLSWHLGGHLHLSSFRRVETAAGPFTDISLPALSAFPSAYAEVDPMKGPYGVNLVPMGDLALPETALPLYRAEGAGPLPATVGGLLALQFRARLMERRLPPDVRTALAEVGAADLVALCPAEEGARQRALALLPTSLDAADMVADGIMLREGGALAMTALSPPRLTFIRAFGDLSRDGSTGQSAIEVWLSALSRVIARAFDRMDRPPGY